MAMCQVILAFTPKLNLQIKQHKLDRVVYDFGLSKSSRPHWWSATDTSNPKVFYIQLSSRPLAVLINLIAISLSGFLAQSAVPEVELWEAEVLGHLTR